MNRGKTRRYRAHGLLAVFRSARVRTAPRYTYEVYRGAVQFLILGILLDGPLSLYNVHKRFTGGISLFHAASFGSIQRALRQLDAQGWVTATNAADSPRRKKLYAITDPGREAWRDWMRAPITASDTEPTMLAKVYLLGQLPVAERGGCLAAIRARVTEDADTLTPWR